MATNVIMPQLGESVVEGTLSRWLKQEGEPVNEYDPLLEVNTDKVDTEIPAPASGVLLKRLVAEGTLVRVGTVLAVIGQPGESAAAPAPAPASVAAAPAPSSAASPSPTDGRRELGFISPVVARIADEHGVDLRQVTGTGQGGRITKKDVLAYVEARASAPAPAAAPPPPPVPAAAPTPPPPPAAPAAPTPPPAGLDLEADSIPVAGLRKAIAEHMLRSKHTAPHVTTVFELDMSRVLAHRAAHKAQFAREGVNLTLTAYFVAASVAALRAVPLVNSQWAEDRILLHRQVNVGVAVAMDDEAGGLIVPVVKNAEEKSLLRLAREVNDLSQRARARALKPDEVVGGTFTISNHGVSGSLFATPIISQPQTAILGVGVLQKRVVVIDDAIAIRPMIYLSLTIDHRVLDGAVADRFLSVIKRTLESWA